MLLPNEFQLRMRNILKDKYDLFAKAYSGQPYKALRINGLKANINIINNFLKLNRQSEFCPDSYYLPDETAKPGNHPFHHAGAYYIQEPSASSVVEAVGINEGDYVLDLCASPGGKSTQAASKLYGTGLLISNEFVSSRVQPLISNIERMGIINCIVTSARPDILCPNLPLKFDKVIVDAPCSGEGMFRKETAAIENWSIENILSCAERQKKIIDNASMCVKPGGKIVYSTCTYAPEENEMVIEYFLEKHKDFKLVKPCIDFGEDAIQRYAKDVENIYYARRIFNFNGGEGHFVAVMQKDGAINNNFKVVPEKVKFDKSLEIFKNFYEDNFLGRVPDNVINVNSKVYITPFNLNIPNVNIIRNGIFAGTIRNDRFIPEHCLFNNSFFKPRNVFNLSLQDKRIYQFIHGEEIECSINLKGYTQVRVENIPLGFGKASNGKLKNHYPKGLRSY